MRRAAGGSHRVFVTGGTGYIGRRLISALAVRGHAVLALVRPGSEWKLPNDCQPEMGDALDAGSFAARAEGCDTIVHLVGTPHPSPRKAAEFRRVDLGSVRASVGAAVAARVPHFVYVSVAQPAPVMRDYVAVRAAGEQTIRDSGMRATILRPWYVIGPGHRWPNLLRPIYWLLEQFENTRASALRLGLVTIDAMVAALVYSVEQPPEGVRILEVDQIRGIGRTG